MGIEEQIHNLSTVKSLVDAIFFHLMILLKYILNGFIEEETILERCTEWEMGKDLIGLPIWLIL